MYVIVRDENWDGKPLKPIQIRGRLGGVWVLYFVKAVESSET